MLCLKQSNWYGWSGYKLSLPPGLSLISQSRRNEVIKKLMLLNCGVGEDSWESLGLEGDPTNPS